MIELTCFIQTLFCNQPKKILLNMYLRSYTVIPAEFFCSHSFVKLLKEDNPSVMLFFLLCKNDFKKMPNFYSPKMTDFTHIRSLNIKYFLKIFASLKKTDI